MRIRFLVNTNVRASARDFSKPPIGVIYSGTEIDVEDRLYRGTAIDGVDTYFKDFHGWYYWSGRVLILYKALMSPEKKADKNTETEGELIGGSWSLELGEEKTVLKTPEVKATVAAPSFAVEPSSDVQQAPVFKLRRDLQHWGMDDFEIPALFWDNDILGTSIRIALLDGPIAQNAPDIKEAITVYKDFTSGDSIMPLENSASTILAGIAAGRGHQAYLGLAPQANLLVGKVWDSMLGIDFYLFLEGLFWALDQGADIIFIPFDFREHALNHSQKKELLTIFQELENKGILCIANAGISNHTRPENRYPASLNNCLSVGGIQKNGERLANEVRSYTLDVMAPAMDLYPQKNNHYIPLGGAYLAGLMALLLQKSRQLHKKLSPGEWIHLMKETATPRFKMTKCKDIEYGCGVVNPQAALEAILP
ncbi:MAG TPA: S8/S53 family peptidase [Saprospiraceae bacterium]|nr:S8/S53 family peptidase [Saprospiraceae bacterium]HMQ84035.1 S8/S53 family peptidase [Saprospiraceae bacterium]